jgi:Fur family ferric uptake transcriptional regulator
MRNIRKQSTEIPGHPITAQRRLLLGLIRSADGHVDAKELYRRATSKDKSISLATVYRSLRLFKEMGLVDERQLGQLRCYYEIRHPREHQHLVCKVCGKVVEFESDLIDRLMEQVQGEHGFEVTKAELYLEGYCQQCKEDRTGGQEDGPGRFPEVPPRAM